MKSPRTTTWERFAEPVYATVGVGSAASEWLSRLPDGGVLALVLVALAASLGRMFYVLTATDPSTVDPSQRVPAFDVGVRRRARIVSALLLLALLVAVVPKPKFEIQHPLFIVFNEKNDSPVVFSPRAAFSLSTRFVPLSESVLATGELTILGADKIVTEPIVTPPRTNIDFYAEFVRPDLYRSIYESGEASITFAFTTTDGQTRTAGPMPFRPDTWGAESIGIFPTSR